MALSRAVVSALADDEATLAALPCEEARILRAVFEKARSDDEKAAADIAVEPQEKAVRFSFPSLVLDLALASPSVISSPHVLFSMITYY